MGKAEVRKGRQGVAPTPNPELDPSAPAMDATLFGPHCARVFRATRGFAKPEENER
jgi:hypothetical protein